MLVKSKQHRQLVAAFQMVKSTPMRMFSAAQKTEE